MKMPPLSAEIMVLPAPDETAGLSATDFSPVTITAAPHEDRQMNRFRNVEMILRFAATVLTLFAEGTTAESILSTRKTSTFS
jgi:hypothetical protein